MMSIVRFFTIGVGLCWIVRVTSILTSWLSPPFATVTPNSRSVPASMMLSVRLGERRPARQRPGPTRCWCRAGRPACVPVPRGGRAVDPLPDRHHRAGAREVGGLDEVGVGHLDPAELRVLLEQGDRRLLEEVVPDDVARDETLGLRGEQRTRGGGVLRPLRALERLREAGQARRRGTASASTAAWWASRSGPGGSSSSALVTPSSCWRTRLVSCVCSSAGLMPCVVSASLSSRPTRSDSRATVDMPAM